MQGCHQVPGSSPLGQLDLPVGRISQTLAERLQPFDLPLSSEAQLHFIETHRFTIPEAPDDAFPQAGLAEADISAPLAEVFDESGHVLSQAASITGFTSRC